MFFTFLVMSFIFTVIGPNLLTKPVLKIIFPLTLITSSVLMHVNTMSIGFII